jgi:hypothetical protein
VRIWNDNLQAWDDLNNLQWGDNSLEIPERYVATDGTLRLSITSTQVSGILITRADFTVELEK